MSRDDFDAPMPATDADPAKMNAWERQQIFREMVIHMLRHGRLSAHRRKRIVQYAACLGITARLAGRLVQEAHRIVEAEDEPSDPMLRLVPREVGSRGRSPLSVLAIVVGAFMLNAWLVLFLFH